MGLGEVLQEVMAFEVTVNVDKFQQMVSRLGMDRGMDGVLVH